MIWTKFAEGAWLVTVAIPVLVFVISRGAPHYRGIVARRLQAGTAAVASAPDARNRRCSWSKRSNRRPSDALAFARGISATEACARFTSRARHTDPGISPRWFRFADGNPLLETLDPRGGAAEACSSRSGELPRGESDFVTVVIPEQFRSRSLVEQARHPFELALKFRLLTENGVVVVDVPTVDEWPSERPLAVRIFASSANAASMRAVNWAISVGLPNTRAVNFAFDDEEAAAIGREWRKEGVRVPLEVLAAPYRDIGDPLLAYLRDLTGDGQEVLVVLPELILRGWARLLHNQRALYVKRLLLVEPHVILASVPYPLLR